MTHDKFCVYEMAPHLPESILKQSCMCERFAEVRADEREQAAQLLADAGYQHSAAFLRNLAAVRGEDASHDA